jgi:pimeloyl-[acyl-carrier protein] methyl ester esterase
VSKTIRRFLALQVRGTGTSMHTVRQLQQAIDKRGLPRKQALRAGLKILSDTDLCAALDDLGCAVTWLLGENDALVPVELAAPLEHMMTDVDINILPGAGHAPFISHPADFVNALQQAAQRLARISPQGAR